MYLACSIKAYDSQLSKEMSVDHLCIGFHEHVKSQTTMYSRSIDREMCALYKQFVRSFELVLITVVVTGQLHVHIWIFTA